MTRTIAALCCLLMTLLGSAAGAQAHKPHLLMTLVADTPRPRAGGTVTLALDTRPEAGWHGYWGENPGDAGFPPNTQWALPTGVSAGAWQWPVPSTLLVSGIMNYVYDRPYAPLATLAVPAGLAAGTRLPVSVHLQYLVCTTSICVPEEQRVAITLTVGDGGGGDARFDGWRRALPKPLGSQASYAAEDGTVRIAVPYPAGTALDAPYLFASKPGLIDAGAPQAVTRDGDRLVIETKGKPTGAIDGVLRVGEGQGLRLSAMPGDVPAARGWVATALLAFAGAVLGGLILNVMPCVFPILSLKALSLARGGESEARARQDALAYTAGVVLVCVALGGAVLLLRAGGSAVGWAFQLQSPRVTALLALLVFGMALNLAGLFELAMPGAVGRLAAKGTGGAFATGVLAAFVATPCTGPFMGAALGAALVLPWAAALAVFAGLGLGLALPFLLLGFVPTLRRRLPKPGPWMAQFRRLLALPMLVTAVWLAWLVGKLGGVDAMAMLLLCATGAAVVLWALGRRQAAGQGSGIAWPMLLVVAAVAAWGIRPGAPAAAQMAAAGEEAFSEARLAQLRAQGTPVFAYFTADWCLTCKVNERVAIEPARDDMKRKGVAVLVGDWTDGDPALGRFIQAHGRAGVPLYLYFAPAQEARVLPQVLTPGMLRDL